MAGVMCACSALPHSPCTEKPSFFEALPEVLKTALIHDGLTCGICEPAKALDKRRAHLCALAGTCDEPTYVKLVEALCAEHHINLIKVDNENLGKWVGLCKIDREGKPRKVWVAAVSLSV
ncbi:40S ribosomal protein S12-like [Sander lucioperca]|uniref:40S ribosomal protein S12-like n=1 Tax=Sander lucioperca TaxID=283035 RepID=UPI0016535FDA|nr:40S ribosomal protein S12-like [Sander lucioperca]